MFQRLGLGKRSKPGVVKIIKVARPGGGVKKTRKKDKVVKKNRETSTTTTTTTTGPRREWLNKESFTKLDKDSIKRADDGDDGVVVARLEMPCVEGYTQDYALNGDHDQMMELQSSVYWIGKIFDPSESIESSDSSKDTPLRRIKRAIKQGDDEQVINGVKDVNSFINHNRQEFKSIIKSSSFSFSTEFIHFLLGTIYARTISPHVDQLVQYQAFSNNVYGELLPPFISMIGKKIGLDSTSIFIDLGSGVGSCVLQASIEFACHDSIGIEIMENASNLAKNQLNEFIQTTKMWGINYGENIKLINGDFLQNSEIIHHYFKKSQKIIILCNNYMFSAELNNHLVDMFLDLPNGSKIISLKSFVPSGHSISMHNIQSPINLLQVQEYDFFSNCRSWTDSPGKYYISTIDRDAISDFLDHHHQSSSSSSC